MDQSQLVMNNWDTKFCVFLQQKNKDIVLYFTIFMHDYSKWKKQKKHQYNI